MLWGEKSDKELEIVIIDNLGYRLLTHSHTHIHTHNTPWDFPLGYDVMMTSTVQQQYYRGEMNSQV